MQMALGLGISILTTTAKKLDVSIYAIQQAFGHTHAKTTEDYVAELEVNSLDEAAKKIMES